MAGQARHFARAVGVRAIMPAPVATDPVGWGERAGEVRIQGGDAVGGEPAQAGQARARRAADRLGMHLAIGGGVVVRG